MQELLEDQVFLLHRHPWKESSYILRLFGHRYGRIDVVGRGLRGNRRGAMVLPHVCCHLEWKRGRGDLGQLSGLKPIGPPAPQPAGDNWWAAQYLSELLLQALPPAEPEPEIFLAYAQTLERLRQQPLRLGLLLRRFEYRLLCALGLGFASNQDALGQALQPNQRYGLHAEQGLLPQAQRGVAAAAWLALEGPDCSVEDEAGLRGALQMALGSLVDFGRLRARSEWQRAQALRKEHQQHAAGNQSGAEQLPGVEPLAQEDPGQQHDP